MNQLRKVITDKWPGYATIEELPVGLWRWVTLVEAPASHLWLLTEEGERELWLGQPFALEPGKRYSVRCGAHTNESLASPNTGAITYRNRRIILELTDGPPVVGGEFRLQFYLGGNTGSLNGLLGRFATRRMEMLTLEAASAGGDASALALGAIDEDAALLTGEARSLGGLTIAGSGNGIMPIFGTANGIVAGATWLLGPPGEHCYLTIVSTYTGAVQLRCSLRGLPFNQGAR